MDVERQPDMQAIGWVVVGLAMASRKYLLRVGEVVSVQRAFCDDAAAAIVAIEANNELTEGSIARLLGLSLLPDEPIGAALLRVLAVEDEAAWDAQHDQAAAAIRDIRQAAARLESAVKTRRKG